MQAARGERRLSPGARRFPRRRGGSAVQGCDDAAMPTGAEGIVAELEAAGVELVFGLPGVHNLGAVGGAATVADPARRRPARAGGGVRRRRLRARHGRLGVALTTTGPGAANTLGAVGEAWASRSPVLVIATDIPSDAAPSRRLPRRAARDDGPGRHVRARRGGEPRRPRRRGRDRRRAGRRGRRRPPPPAGVPRGADRPARGRPAGGHGGCRWAAAATATALRRPTRTPPTRSSTPPSARWSGRAAARATGAAEVAALAERLAAPVLTTYTRPRRAPAGASVRGRHAAARPGRRPAVGRGGRGHRLRLRPRRRATRRTGSSPSRRDSSPSTWTRPTPRRTTAWTRSCRRSTRSACGARDGRDALAARIREVRAGDVPRARPDRPAVPRRRVLRAARGRRGGLRHVRPRLLGRRPSTASTAPRLLQFPMGWGTLGFAFPAALGAALAGTGPTVAIAGDGGFLFACGELATMAQEAHPAHRGDRRRRRLRDAALRPDAVRRDALRRRPPHARLRRARARASACGRDGGGARRRVRRGARPARREAGPSVLVARAPGWCRRRPRRRTGIAARRRSRRAQSPNSNR